MNKRGPCPLTHAHRVPLVVAALGTWFVALAAAGCGAAEPVGKPELAEQRARAAKLAPLHKKLAPAAAGEWLAEHKETPQTFEQYTRSAPVTPSGKRRVIYIQPLGDFSPTQKQMVELTAEFMSLYFDRPVKILAGLPLADIPAAAQRKHPTWGMNQVLTSHVLHKVLAPRLPDDAAAYIAFTTSDLWPGAGWNFVFGEASLRERVGVWSIYRNGDPEENAASFRLCLLRTLKTATHETGHMFSLPHCTFYECNMCGSNHREESDRRPVYLCPECAAKVWWATGCDPATQCKKLATFCGAHELKEEQTYYEQAAALLAR